MLLSRSFIPTGLQISESVRTINSIQDSYNFGVCSCNSSESVLLLMEPWDAASLKAINKKNNNVSFSID